jgi:hypothetical protein
VSVRQARTKYNDRGSEEGQQAHRIEEMDRRARRAAERVGDHRCHEESEELRMRPSTAPHAVSETIDAALIAVALPPIVEVADLPPRRGDPNGELREGAPAGGLGWVLVAWPELLAAANQRLGSETSCPFCRRQGRIVKVISVERWRRRSRR